MKFSIESIYSIGPILSFRRVVHRQEDKSIQIWVEDYGKYKKLHLICPLNISITSLITYISSAFRTSVQ